MSRGSPRHTLYVDKRTREAEQNARQQAYELRIESARQMGTTRLIDYHETVIAGKPYAMVRYEGETLKMVPIKD